MFIIGILSSPIPYILISFVYLLGLSYGLFSTHEQSNTNDEFHSNIINYEELTPINKVLEEDAAYFSFFKSKSCTQTINYNEVLKMFFEKRQIVDLFIEKTNFYNFLLSSHLSNRPPPSIALI